MIVHGGATIRNEILASSLVTTDGELNANAYANGSDTLVNTLSVTDNFVLTTDHSNISSVFSSTLISSQVVINNISQGGHASVTSSSNVSVQTQSGQVYVRGQPGSLQLSTYTPAESGALLRLSTFSSETATGGTIYIGDAATDRVWVDSASSALEITAASSECGNGECTVDIGDSAAPIGNVTIHAENTVTFGADTAIVTGAATITASAESGYLAATAVENVEIAGASGVQVRSSEGVVDLVSAETVYMVGSQIQASGSQSVSLLSNANLGIDANNILTLTANAIDVSTDQDLGILSSSGNVTLTSQSGGKVILAADHVQLDSSDADVALASTGHTSISATGEISIQSSTRSTILASNGVFVASSPAEVAVLADNTILYYGSSTQVYTLNKLFLTSATATVIAAQLAVSASNIHINSYDSHVAADVMTAQGTNGMNLHSSYGNIVLQADSGTAFLSAEHSLFAVSQLHSSALSQNNIYLQSLSNIALSAGGNIELSSATLALIVGEQNNTACAGYEGFRLCPGGECVQSNQPCAQAGALDLLANAPVQVLSLSGSIMVNSTNFTDIKANNVALSGASTITASAESGYLAATAVENVEIAGASGVQVRSSEGVVDLVSAETVYMVGSQIQASGSQSVSLLSNANLGIDANNILTLTANAIDVSTDQDLGILSSSGNVTLTSQSSGKVILAADHVQLDSSDADVALASTGHTSISATGEISMQSSTRSTILASNGSIQATSNDVDIFATDVLLLQSSETIILASAHSVSTHDATSITATTQATSVSASTINLQTGYTSFKLDASDVVEMLGQSVNSVSFGATQISANSDIALRGLHQLRATTSGGPLSLLASDDISIAGATGVALNSQAVILSAPSSDIKFDTVSVAKISSGSQVNLHSVAGNSILQAKTISVDATASTITGSSIHLIASNTNAHIFGADFCASVWQFFDNEITATRAVVCTKRNNSSRKIRSLHTRRMRSRFQPYRHCSYILQMPCCYTLPTSV